MLIKKTLIISNMFSDDTRTPVLIERMFAETDNNRKGERNNLVLELKDPNTPSFRRTDILETIENFHKFTKYDSQIDNLDNLKIFESEMIKLDKTALGDGNIDEITDETLKGTPNPTFFSNNRRRKPRHMDDEGTDKKPGLGGTFEDRKKTYARHREEDIEKDKQRLTYLRLRPGSDLESMYSLLEFLYLELHEQKDTQNPDRFRALFVGSPNLLPKLLRYLRILKKIKSYNGIYNDETSREIISMALSPLPVPSVDDVDRELYMFLYNGGWWGRGAESPRSAFTYKDRAKLPEYPIANRIYQNR